MKNLKNKKIVIIFSITLIIIIIGGYFAIKYVKNKKSQETIDESVPEQEITEEQFRQTIVSLYFQNKETKGLTPEARLIDIREIINNPYEKLITLLLEGPKNDKLERLIPENTKVLKTYMENDCVVIDLSKEFLEYEKNSENVKNNIIDSIVNTLTELTEVNKVKILIEGQKNDNFKEIYTRKNNF